MHGPTIRSSVRWHARIGGRGCWKRGGTDRLGNWPKQSVTRSFVNRLLRLTLLAPDIVEAILEGRPPKGYGAGGVDRVKSK